MNYLFHFRAAMSRILIKCGMFIRQSLDIQHEFT